VVRPNLVLSKRHLIHIPGNPSRSSYVRLLVPHLAGSAVVDQGSPNQPQVPLVVQVVEQVVVRSWLVVHMLVAAQQALQRLVLRQRFAFSCVLV
jgi:hypothetical protein